MLYLRLLFIIIILLSSYLLAQKKESTVYNGNKVIEGNQSSWDLQLFFDLTTSTGPAYGAEFDGNYFYAVWWAYGAVQKYDIAGNFIEEFTVSGFTGILDLTFDGNYMYGGKLTNKIYKMDFVNKTVIDSFNSPVSVRHIAYDASQDAFWVGDFSTGIYLVDRNGITLSTIPPVLYFDISGTAWDNISPGGPYLWLFDSYNALIRQMKIPEGTLTGVSHDVHDDLGNGTGGGLFITSDFIEGTLSIGGMLRIPDKIFVYELASTAPFCPVGPAVNPSPANNSINVPVSLQQLSWINPTGSGSAVSNDVYFGTNPGTMDLIHSGSLVSSVDLPYQLQFSKTYYWKVVEKNDNCSGVSTLWKFKTVIYSPLICDDFSSFNWTPLGPQGMTNWSTNTSNNAGGNSPELRFNWSPSFVGESRLLSPLTHAPQGTAINFYFSHFIDWYANPAGVFKVGYTKDGGNTITNIWSLSNPTGNVGPEFVSFYYPAPGDTFQIILSYQGDSYNIDYWYIDDLCNFWWWPVEFTSFTAEPSNNDIIISWSTATETNNRGFELERKTTTGFWEAIAFIPGNGTTTDPHDYSYTDRNLSYEKYSYRLKQIDYDGNSTYSIEIETSVWLPLKLSLRQNYPNPFNPKTTISYSVPDNNIVKLSIYDILGNEIVVLVDEQKPAGEYQVEWDASAFSSGVYFYRLTAGEFTSTKKLLLMK